LPKPGTLNPNVCVHRKVRVSDSEGDVLSLHAGVAG